MFNFAVPVKIESISLLGFADKAHVITVTKSDGSEQDILFRGVGPNGAQTVSIPNIDDVIEVDIQMEWSEGAISPKLILM